MITVYRVFQLILGIIVSGFVLYFLISYASDYADFGDTRQMLTIADNLRTTVDQVYFSGNPIVFGDTDRFDFSSCGMVYMGGSPPQMSCDFGDLSPFVVPALLSMRPEEEVLVDAQGVGYGWWDASFATVMPGTSIVLNPMDASDLAWDTMEEVTRLLPSTEGFDTKVTFTFCDGVVLNVCGGKRCEREDFLRVLGSTVNTPAVKCSSVPSGDVLVTVSQSCSPGFVSQGICIRPDPTIPGLGRVYTQRSQDIFVYKDPADIAALIIGWSSGGPSGAESLYEYKNRLFSERLYLAAQVMERRAYVLKSKYQAECASCIDQQCTYCVCHPLYDSLEESLKDVMGRARRDHNDYMEMENLKAGLDQASSIYQELLDRGCEP